jgi:hypothetical protein
MWHRSHIAVCRGAIAEETPEKLYKLREICGRDKVMPAIGFSPLLGPYHSPDAQYRRKERLEETPIIRVLIDFSSFRRVTFGGSDG